LNFIPIIFFKKNPIVYIIN